MVFMLSVLPAMGSAKISQESVPIQAGTAMSVKGDVKATTPPAKSAHRLKEGSEIFMGDKIETGPDGQLKILLLDKTVFTLGPLSTIAIDEFVYDPENAEEKSSVVKGIFRAVSSKVAKRDLNDAPEEKASTPETASASFSEAQEKSLKLADQIGDKPIRS